jgi:hypothetical protein
MQSGRAGMPHSALQHVATCTAGNALGSARLPALQRLNTLQIHLSALQLPCMCSWRYQTAGSPSWQPASYSWAPQDMLHVLSCNNCQHTHNHDIQGLLQPRPIHYASCLRQLHCSPAALRITSQTTRLLHTSTISAWQPAAGCSPQPPESTSSPRLEHLQCTGL